MSAHSTFSLTRFWAIVVKEFIQMRRDRVTFGMMIGIPLIQLVLFGFAINADPKHLPTVVLLADYGPHGQTLLQAIRNSHYFEFVREVGGFLCYACFSRIPLLVLLVQLLGCPKRNVSFSCST
jgi:ABC-2 type transport system permease protein